MNSESSEHLTGRWKRLGVLGTPLECTNYAELTARCHELARSGGTFAVDFTNTQIVTMRRCQPEFRKATERFDLFVPDGMPLIWCLNSQGAGLRDRVYGPTFMRYCVLASPEPFAHYFLGGSQECLERLKAAFLSANPRLRIVGCRHGYFPACEEDSIVEEINRLRPSFIWVGLGTPKQQQWIYRNKPRIHQGVIFAVGFAFDVNAGTKPDAPMWMQRLGLTWAFRLASEPRRLFGRYLRYNTLFLLYLLRDGLRGRAFATEL
ncbi:MAG: WecB/TagA/CpsF family glycosyltransferase [Verrucomicrobiae bacterium]|nr:WecB/TagA/CpsF family glycosyltransferase [Verrucomicrobiae bacterium]